MLNLYYITSLNFNQCYNATFNRIMRIFATLLILTILSGCREKSIPVSLKSDIDSIILKWVPDKREGICSVEMVKLPGDIIKLNG